MFKLLENIGVLKQGTGQPYEKFFSLESPIMVAGLVLICFGLVFWIIGTLIKKEVE